MPGVENSTSALETGVRDIVTLLSKAAKNYQVYLPNNRIFLNSLAEAHQALAHYLDENEVLTLVVKEFELLFDKNPVYSNQEKHQSLAFRMYRDGVRLISFHAGISEDELVAFFEALTRCLDCENLEEDFVTLLWEKDLQCITYYEVNDYDAEYQGRHRDSPGDIDPEFHAPGNEITDAKWTEVTRDIERMMPALDLTPGDLDEVKNLALVIEDDLFLKRSWQVLSSTLDICGTRDACLDLENAVTGFLDVCVHLGQLGIAAEALVEVKTRLATYPGSDIRAALSRIVESRHSDANMEVVTGCLVGDRETEHEQCHAYLAQLSQAALPSIIRTLSKCSRQSARQVVVMSLAAIAEDDPGALARCSATSSEEEIDAVLDALAAIGSESALIHAMDFRDHDSSKIRAKVAAMAPRLKNGMALDVTQVLVQDSNPAVRRRALASLVEIGGKRCVETLTDLFTSNEFNMLPRDKKTSMLLVMRNLPPADQKRMIEIIFKMRRWMRNKPLDDTKAAVIDILHLMHGDVIDYFIDNIADRAPGALQKPIDAALKKVRRDGHNH
jgi:hypothetical protein